MVSITWIHLLNGVVNMEMNNGKKIIISIAFIGIVLVLLFVGSYTFKVSA